ncbi:MAG: N-6 DNA methylase [Gammaproteobacteria bacterium]|nr:N-6 DNA methylase [Gammaproteobacteria bacterium]
MDRHAEPHLASTELELERLAAVLLKSRPGGEVADKTGSSPFDRLAEAIKAGEDPLGEQFCRLRSAEVRRRDGAVYTPRPIVDAMVRWAAGTGRNPDRVVDPGAGSGRFLLAAGKAFPNAALVAVEPDPLAGLLLRANARVLGMDTRLTVLSADYRSISLPEIPGPTLFVGNPPYVRHHGISKYWKDWFANGARQLGLKASKLAGLHVHFLLKTHELAATGDYGAFITAAEWLDVNYGDFVRKLLIRELGGTSVHVIKAGTMPFAGTASTAAITCFRVGNTDTGMRFRTVTSVDGLVDLHGGVQVPPARLETSSRWSTLLRPMQSKPYGYVELGELCRVHRGQVTGCNRAWIAGTYPGELPDSVLKPVVTRARELFEASPALENASALRRVVSLPFDLDELDTGALVDVERFLDWAKGLGADRTYVARHRRTWWSIPLKDPAPVLCTYMARRRPAFVRNLCGARHLNIAHGIYPRDAMATSLLDSLSAWLQGNVSLSAGRVYAGGLTKFEPREVERILVPPLEELHERTTTLDIGRTDARRRERSRVLSPMAAD